MSAYSRSWRGARRPKWLRSIYSPRTWRTSAPAPRPMTRPLRPESDAQPHALLDYLASLQATRELPAKLVLSGHGEPIVDHVALIDERVRMHQRRARKILAMLADGPLSGYEIALRMWG